MDAFPIPDPRKAFLIDGAVAATFDDLYKFVEDADSYFPSMRAGDFVSGCFNFLAAVARGADVSLLDSAASDTELEHSGIVGVNIRSSLSGRRAFGSYGEFVSAVRLSQSRVGLFTSGTCGSPRRVEVSAAKLASGARRSALSDVWGFAFNPSHIAAMQVLFQAFLNGNTVVYLFGKSPASISNALKKYRATHISATPTFYRMLTSTCEVFGDVRRATVGGERFDSFLKSKMSSVFPSAKINNIYASTEFGSMLVSDGEYFRIPKCMSKFVKISGNRIFASAEIAGDFGAKPDADGFFPTGDTVEFYPYDTSKFRILGRTSDIVNVGGIKVALAEVEDAARALNGVADAVAYGRKNSVLGNVVCCDIKPEVGIRLSISDVSKMLAGRLQRHKMPAKIRIVENLESTRTGKLKR